MKLTRKISKDKEGLYYTVPFSVPENVVKITVSYDYFKPTKGLLCVFPAAADAVCFAKEKQIAESLKFLSNR